MKHLFLLAAGLALACTGSALAAVKVVNKDSSSHDLLVKCSSAADTSISGSSTRDIGNGPCTVSVKKTGSTATATGNEILTIQDGKISK